MPLDAARTKLHPKHHMMLVALVATFATSPALADRALNQDEQTKVVAALSAQGCSGGQLSYDDGLYEVDDAKCHDGHEYDFKFDRDMKLIHKDLEH